MGAAQIIDGKAVAGRVREEVRADVAAFAKRHGRAPALATVLVGDDQASQIYVASKERACAEVGIGSLGHELPPGASQEELLRLIGELNEDPAVSGILVQLPVPDQIDQAAVVGAIDPKKDVDGLTPVSAGLLVQGQPGLRPCTPAGIIELLDSVETDLAGACAVVLGRSQLVGKPVATMLLERNATVTICHSRTRDLAAVCGRADVLIAAVGRPHMVGGEMVKRGATVIDVGINRTASGVVGDVDFEAVIGTVKAITPVPGGVGPMTIAMLLRNTVAAAQGQSAENRG